MNHLALFSNPHRKIQAGMKVSLSAFTSGLATDPGHRDQRADEEGLLVEQLGQAGAGLALLRGKVSTVAHNDLLYSDIYKYIRIKDIRQAFLKCESAPSMEFN
jgi:hypothetical protein